MSSGSERVRQLLELADDVHARVHSMSQRHTSPPYSSASSSFASSYSSRRPSPRQALFSPYDDRHRGSSTQSTQNTQPAASGSSSLTSSTAAPRSLEEYLRHVDDTRSTSSAARDGEIDVDSLLRSFQQQRFTPVSSPKRENSSSNYSFLSRQPQPQPQLSAKVERPSLSGMGPVVPKSSTSVDLASTRSRLSDANSRTSSDFALTSRYLGHENRASLSAAAPAAATSAEIASAARHAFSSAALSSAQTYSSDSSRRESMTIAAQPAPALRSDEELATTDEDVRKILNDPIRPKSSVLASSRREEPSARISQPSVHESEQEKAEKKHKKHKKESSKVEDTTREEKKHKSRSSSRKTVDPEPLPVSKKDKHEQKVKDKEQKRESKEKSKEAIKDAHREPEKEKKFDKREAVSSSSSRPKDKPVASSSKSKSVEPVVEPSESESESASSTSTAEYVKGSLNRSSSSRLSLDRRFSLSRRPPLSRSASNASGVSAVSAGVSRPHTSSSSSSDSLSSSTSSSSTATSPLLGGDRDPNSDDTDALVKNRRSSLLRPRSRMALPGTLSSGTGNASAASSQPPSVQGSRNASPEPPPRPSVTTKPEPTAAETGKVTTEPVVVQIPEVADLRDTQRRLESRFDEQSHLLRQMMEVLILRMNTDVAAQVTAPPQAADPQHATVEARSSKSKSRSPERSEKSEKPRKKHKQEEREPVVEVAAPLLPAPTSSAPPSAPSPTTDPASVSVPVPALAGPAVPAPAPPVVFDEVEMERRIREKIAREDAEKRERERLEIERRLEEQRMDDERRQKEEEMRRKEEQEKLEKERAAAEERERQRMEQEDLLKRVVTTVVAELVGKWGPQVPPTAVQQQSPPPRAQPQTTTEASSIAVPAAELPSPVAVSREADVVTQPRAHETTVNSLVGEAAPVVPSQKPQPIQPQRSFRAQPPVPQQPAPIAPQTVSAKDTQHVHTASVNSSVASTTPLNSLPAPALPQLVSRHAKKETVAALPRQSLIKREIVSSDSEFDPSASRRARKPVSTKTFAPSPSTSAEVSSSTVVAAPAPVVAAPASSVSAPTRSVSPQKDEETQTPKKIRSKEKEKEKEKLKEKDPKEGARKPPLRRRELIVTKDEQVQVRSGDPDSQSASRRSSVGAPINDAAKHVDHAQASAGTAVPSSSITAVVEDDAAFFNDLRELLDRVGSPTSGPPPVRMEVAPAAAQAMHGTKTATGNIGSHVRTDVPARRDASTQDMSFGGDTSVLPENESFWSSPMHMGQRVFPLMEQGANNFSSYGMHPAMMNSYPRQQPMQGPSVASAAPQQRFAPQFMPASSTSNRMSTAPSHPQPVQRPQQAKQMSRLGYAPSNVLTHSHYPPYPQHYHQHAVPEPPAEDQSFVELPMSTSRGVSTFHFSPSLPLERLTRPMN